MCIFCIVTLEPLSTLSVSFLFLIYIFIADNISISMYIMCVILCLFSALSGRVGAFANLHYYNFVIVFVVVVIFGCYILPWADMLCRM